MYITTKIGWAAAPCALVASVLFAKPVQAQQPADTAYRAMQQRGQQTMGVDQATSSQSFQSLPDGGRIIWCGTWTPESYASGSTFAIWSGPSPLETSRCRCSCKSTERPAT
jgi:hypothetical protein